MWAPGLGVESGAPRANRPVLYYILSNAVARGWVRGGRGLAERALQQLDLAEALLHRLRPLAQLRVVHPRAQVGERVLGVDDPLRMRLGVGNTDGTQIESDNGAALRSFPC